MCQVLIIGAGPAGTSCAIQLCKAGFDVTIIDITTFPRFRPGESCHPGIEPLLKQLEVWEEIQTMNPMRNKSIWINNDGIVQEEFYNKERNWEGFQLPRDEFDAILLNKAIQLGAKFYPATRTVDFITCENTVTSIRTSKGVLKADIFIDATGSKAISAVKLKINKKIYSNKIITCYTQIVARQNLDRKYNSYFEITKNYWGYIALIKPCLYSITYSSPYGNGFSNKEFINKNFPINYSIEISRKYDTSWAMISESKFKNLFFVGDALLTFDPTSSKGILKSIMTGIYLSHNLHQFNEKKISLSTVLNLYRNWYTSFFFRELNSIKSLLLPDMSNKIFKTATSI